MENKVLEKNISIIANYNQSLANEILMLDIEKSNISLSQNENGEYNLIYNNFLMHSNESPTLEAKNIVQKIENSKEQNYVRIVYGLGLGYLLDEIAQEITKAPIILYEPNLDILKFILSVANIDALEKNNVFIVNNKDNLKEMVLKNSNVDTRLTITFLNSYKNLFENDIQDVINNAQIAIGQHKANKNTFELKAPKALWNTFRNLKYILNNSNITDFKDVYKDKTALVLSAGPSLSKNIEIIKQNQEKFVIFAVNPAVRLLAQNNIKIDFIVDIETGDTTKQFDCIDVQENVFILEAFAHPKVFELQTKKTINYISNSNFYNPWVKSWMNLNDDLESFGTVSYTALMSAYVMGFNKIILCGQDLIYQDGNCYAKGSQFENLKCVFDDELKKYVIKADNFDEYVESLKSETIKIEDAKKMALHNINFLNSYIVTVKNQNGQNRPTQAGYAMFIEWFRNAAQKIKQENSQIQLINSSTNGAQIDGFENMGLAQAVQNLEIIEKVDVTKFSPKEISKENQIKIEKVYCKILKLKEILIELISITQKLEKELKIKKIYTDNILKLKQKQDNLLLEFLKYKSDNDLKFIIAVESAKFVDLIIKNSKNNPANELENQQKLFVSLEKVLEDIKCYGWGVWRYLFNK